MSDLTTKIETPNSRCRKKETFHTKIKTTKKKLLKNTKKIIEKNVIHRMNTKQLSKKLYIIFNMRYLINIESIKKLIIFKIYFENICNNLKNFVIKYAKLNKPIVI